MKYLPLDGKTIPPLKTFAYTCHCFQHHLVIYFEVNDSYIALF